MGVKNDAQSVLDSAWNHFQLGSTDFDDDLLPSMLDVLPVGVCVADGGLIVYGNRAASSLLERRVKSGLKLEVFVKRHHIYRVGSDELYPVDQLPLARATSGASCYADDLEVRREGRSVRFAMRAAPLCDRAGSVQFTVATLHDSGTAVEGGDEPPLTVPSPSSPRASGLAPAIHGALLGALPHGASSNGSATNGASLNGASIDAGLSNAPPALGSESLMPGSEVRVARNLEAIGELAAGVAHEINTPMQYIGDNTAFLDVTVRRLLDLAGSFERLVAVCRSGQLPSDEILGECERDLTQRRLAFLRTQAPAAIEQTISGIDQVRSIVQALKEFSHPGDDEAVPVDVNRLIRMATTVTRNAWRYAAELSLELCEDPPAVNGYPQEIGQVLINLIVNAAHAIEERLAGESERRLGKIVVRTRAVGDDVVIEIADDGAGIPEAVRDRIMNPFFTTKPAGKGTGQGLALAQRVVVERHQGHLSFETEVGVGTTFFIVLPRRRDG